MALRSVRSKAKSGLGALPKKVVKKSPVKSKSVTPPKIGGGFMPQPAFDPSGLQKQIGGLQKQIGNIPRFDPATLNLPDFSNFATRSDLENRPIYDDTALRDQITSIAQRPGFDDTALRQMIEQNANRPGFDSSGLESQISGLQNQFSNMPQFDDSALRQMIEQNANRPEFDASGLQSQIGGLQDQFKNLPQFDDSQLQSQISGLQNQ